MKQVLSLIASCALMVAVVSATDDAIADKEERLIGAVVTSTTTLDNLQTTTVTRPLTCLIGAPATAACTGRRRRRRAARKDFDPPALGQAMPAPVSIDSSLSLDHGKDDRSGKVILFATRYITSASDFTTTITLTDSGTTVSVSVLCTFPGLTYTDSFRLC